MSFTSVSGKKWVFKNFSDADVKDYSEKYSLSEIVSKLIAIRNKNFINPDLYLKPTIKKLLPNPLILKDMQKAVDRTCQSIKKKETIGIFGDYDVDGATSTALLSLYFSSINKDFNTYIPDRKKEGYGPSVKGFDSLINNGSKIIFTVDCGTLSFKAINHAQKKQVDIIVLDHHQSDVKIPDACAVVNPNRYDDSSELNYLCAAGVCFMFIVALNRKLINDGWFNKEKIEIPNILNLLDLVCLGTVCDVVPLVGLNRALVKQGLKIIKNRSNLGLKTLYDLCNIKSQPSTFDLGFKLGPRINAGGRVGKSSHGAELLISKDPSKAYKIATDLEKYNNERKSIETILIDEVSFKAKNLKNDPVIILSGYNWHEGIIGIIASKIKDKYNKPTILISLDKNLGKGSARSIPGFDIGTHIIKCVQSGILDKGGGHKMAGGFTIKNSNITKFKDFLFKEIRKLDLNILKTSNLYLDSKISALALNEDFFNEVNSLAPFGSGNSEPRFAIENLKVINSNIVGKNHIKSVLVAKNGFVFKSIAWNAINSELEPYLTKKKGPTFNVAGKMHLNDWNGKKNVEFIIEDILTIPK